MKELRLNKNNIIEWMKTISPKAAEVFGDSPYRQLGIPELLETYGDMTPDEAIKEDIERCL